MTGYHFIFFIIIHSKQYRCQYSIDPYTFNQILHLFIIQHLERMIFKRMDLTDFYLHCRFFIYHTQQFINACQFNLFATSIFHFSKPPVLSSYMLRQLFLSGSACRCFFPLHWSQQLLQTSGSHFQIPRSDFRRLYVLSMQYPLRNWF